MIVIKDRAYIDIRIDGKVIPTSYNLIREIVLTEGNNALFPACRIVFDDASGNLSDALNLTDGNSLVITVGKNPNDVGTCTRQYRLFAAKRFPSPAGPTIVVVGIYDAPEFITANVSEGFSGPSTEVMADIATKCKLYYDGPDSETDDSQTWLNVCRNRASFVQDVTRHGYVDEYSAMSFVLTSLGVLKYKNMMTEVEKVPKYTLYYNTPPGESNTTDYYVKQGKNTSTSGVVNSWQNYGSTKVVHSLSGTQVLENKVDVKTTGSFLAINSQVAGTVNTARIECSPLDCSNVSSKYERALYQNIRMLALFCDKQSVLLTDVSDIQLFDVVYYRQADSDIKTPSEACDIYIVVGKTVFVKGSSVYAERLEIARMTVSNPGASALTTQDPATLRDSVIPASVINPTILTAASTIGLIKLVTQMFQPIGQYTGSAFGNISQLGMQSSSMSSPLGLIAGIISSPGGIAANIPAVLTLLPDLAAGSSALSTTSGRLAGNYINIAGSIGSVGQQVEGLPVSQQNQISSGGLLTASLVNNSGLFNALALGLPALSQLSQLSAITQLVNTELSNNSGLLVASGPMGTQGLIDSFNANSVNINSNYSSMDTSVTDSWNNGVSISNNQPIPSNLAPYSNHSSTFQALTTFATAVPTNQVGSINSIVDTTNELAVVVAGQDSNRDLNWAPSSPIFGNASSTSSITNDVAQMSNSASGLSLLTSENYLV